MGVVPLAESEFVLILEQPIDVALELPRRLRDQLLAWSTVGFGFALVIAWFTTRAVIKPTEQLTLAADRIGGGDLDTPIRVTARDEFGVLADRFESMRQQIANAYEAVEESNIVLESRVKERTAQLGKLLNRLIWRRKTSGAVWHVSFMMRQRRRWAQSRSPLRERVIRLPPMTGVRLLISNTHEKWWTR